MAQRSSAATQMKTTRVQNLFVSQDEIDRYAKNIFGLVEHRAYQLFEERGRENGCDTEDWFKAEREVLEPITIELGDPGDAYTVVAIVSGYRPEDLKINAEPLRVTICGLSGATKEHSEGAQKGTRNSGQFFFSFTLPTEVDAAAASADLNRDVLEVRLPKAQPKPESFEF